MSLDWAEAEKRLASGQAANDGKPATSVAEAAKAFQPVNGPSGLQVGRLLLRTVDDAAETPARPYIIKGLVYRGDFGAIYGPPGAGKSFKALHLSYCAALGPDELRRATGSDRVFGHRVRKTRVLYVFAEGEGGAVQRIQAIRRKLGECPDFVFIAQPMNLHDDPVALAEVIAAAWAVGAEWIVIDTLNRVMGGGDENSPDGMGRMLSVFAELRQATGATVTVVHHAGKDGSRGMRGHSSLHGACDHEIEVTRPEEDGPRVARLAKAKDDADGARWGFNLARTVLGVDDDGDEISSCTVEPAEAGEGGRRWEPTGQTRLVWDILRDTLARSGRPGPPSHEHIPAGVTVAQVSQWRAEVYARLFPDDSDEVRRKAFRRALDRLLQARWLGCWEGWVWTAQENDR